MKNLLLRTARLRHGWNQQQLADFAGISLSTVERAERGEPIRIDSIQRLCACLQQTPEQVGLLNRHEGDRHQAPQAPQTLAIDPDDAWNRDHAVSIQEPPSFASLWGEDLLAVYARGIAACQDLYYDGHPQQVEAILPLYSRQIALLAQQTGLLQLPAARLASQAYQLTCELATDHENFGAAQWAGRQALSYAQLATDANLQVAALISLANLSFHLSSAQPDDVRKHSKDALDAYTYALSLFGKEVSPLLKGRTYAGIAEVYAMRGQLQETMRAMGLAYEHFPLQPENDPAYPYLRASRYSLYVFGDAQSRLFLGQPKEANNALLTMQQETSDPVIEPITRLDMLYYQADVQIQSGEPVSSSDILTEAATLAKRLGSRLYYNKLLSSYHRLQAQWPREASVATLDDVFQPW